MLLLGFYSTEILACVHKDMYVQMLKIMASFVTEKMEKQSRSLSIG